MVTRGRCCLAPWSPSAGIRGGGAWTGRGPAGRPRGSYPGGPRAALFEWLEVGPGWPSEGRSELPGAVRQHSGWTQALRYHEAPVSDGRTRLGPSPLFVRQASRAAKPGPPAGPAAAAFPGLGRGVRAERKRVGPGLPRCPRASGSWEVGAAGLGGPGWRGVDQTCCHLFILGWSRHLHPTGKDWTREKIAVRGQVFPRAA